MKAWFLKSLPAQNLMAGVVSFWALTLVGLCIALLNGTLENPLIPLKVFFINQFFLMSLMGVITGLLYHFSMHRFNKLNHYLKAGSFFSLGYFVVSFQAWETSLSNYFVSFVLIILTSQLFSFLLVKCEALAFELTEKSID